MLKFLNEKATLNDWRTWALVGAGALVGGSLGIICGRLIMKG